MGKPAKKPPEAKKGAPLWMATFSDMVTLLLTFFVLLVSMASFEDQAKSEALSSSLQNAFGVGGDDVSLVLQNLEASFPSAILVKPDDPAQEAKLREGLKAYIEALIPPGKGHEQEMRLSLDDNLLFAPGSAELRSEHLPFLNQIAALIRDLDGVTVEVEGHADASGDPITNRRLAGERALVVADALRTRSVPGDRLAASTRGHHSTAITPGGDQALNRRVDLVFRGDQRAVREAADRIAGVHAPPNTPPPGPPTGG